MSREAKVSKQFAHLDQGEKQRAQLLSSLQLSTILFQSVMQHMFFMKHMIAAGLAGLVSLTLEN